MHDILYIKLIRWRMLVTIPEHFPVRLFSSHEQWTHIDTIFFRITRDIDVKFYVCENFKYKKIYICLDYYDSVLKKVILYNNKLS